MSKDGQNRPPLSSSKVDGGGGEAEGRAVAVTAKCRLLVVRISQSINVITHHRRRRPSSRSDGGGSHYRRY